MNTAIFYRGFTALLLSAVCTLAAEQGKEVVLDPAEGKIATDTSFTISFPDDMVASDQIQAGDAKWPIVADPPFDGRFLWQSQTEGQLQVRGRLIPGAHYRLSTAPGLKDARGQAVAKQSWNFDTDPFEVKSNEDPRESLSAQPRFELSANYPVSMLDAAEHIFFQDRDSHERYPVEVLLGSDASADRDSTLMVTPRRPLPIEHTFDLVVDGLCDGYAHKPLAFLHVFPAGTTDALDIQWVGAFNHALEPAQIRAKFTERIDPDSVQPGALKITPPVPDVKLHAELDEVIAEGSFDPKKRYVVVIGPGLKGQRGFGLAAEQKWGATFHPKESTIVFPGNEVFQRSAMGLKFAFLQVNTGPTKWTLSAVPMSRLPEMVKRVQQYKSGEKPLDLKVIGSGQFDANGATEELLREIDWQAPAPLSGPYVLEASGPGADGEIEADRTLICFSEYFATQKRDNDSAVLRVAKMTDGLGVAGLRVRAITADNVELASDTTDSAGLAHFPTDRLFPDRQPRAELFVIETPSGLAIQYVDAPALAFASVSQETDSLRAIIVTDRNLYRPGQTVKMHGVVRIARARALETPSVQPVTWSVQQNGEQPIATGKAELSTRGTWDADWAIPTGLATGDYQITCELGAMKSFQTSFKVEEYRVPLFSVELEQQEPEGPVAKLSVASAYFHGAPNATAKVHWKAVWLTSREASEDKLYRTDAYSEHHLESDDEKTVEGDATLDAHGAALLVCEPPYKDNFKRGRCSVDWTVDVTSAEAQTMSAGQSDIVQLTPAWVGIRADSVGKKVTIDLDALDFEDEPVKGAAVHVDLFHVSAKTVKEKLAPFIVRYRNTREFEKVASREATTPSTLAILVSATGDYVAVATGPGGVQCSTELSVAGDEEAEFPVENEVALGVSLPEPVRAYRPGEIAPLSIRAPFAGVAWVTVEAESILDSKLLTLSGNAARIDLPIKKEYSPNATVTVYLVKPGGDKHLPMERIGQLQIAIERPDETLVVTPKMTSEKVKPSAEVSGEVVVTSEDHPVAGADFLVFAVDDAVLKLGGWSLPDYGSFFYPERQLSVSTYAALSRFVEKIERKSLQQKGYVVGDGGESLSSVPALRKEFKTLAFWAANLTTDAAGKLSFHFTAPDNLTEYRLVAVGQTERNQFGAGMTTFKVSKPLLCEPALPRFVRIGDDVTLRAVARQSIAPTGKITVRCSVEGMDLTDPAPVTNATAQDVPSVFNFHAKVQDVSTAAKVRFEATSDLGESDAVELALPILPPTVLRHETVATSIDGGSFRPERIAPKSWRTGRGAFDVTVSTSPWLAKLTGLPQILQYPHGCFEQISSRVLAYALMADLLASVPDAQSRDANYQAMLATSMKRYEESLLADGMLPYWPGNTYSNPFCTTLAAWAVQEAQRSGLEPSANLQDKLQQSLERIATGRERYVDSFTQCLALMILAKPGAAGDYASVAQDLYLKRDKISDEGRALLAIALHKMGAMEKETTQLVKEFSKPLPERAFDPVNFGSTTRAQALTTLALAEIAPTGSLMKLRREQLLTLMDSSASLSTQENLWLLIAFKAMHDARPPEPLNVADLRPEPLLVSKNKTGVEWTSNDLARLGSFSFTGLPNEPLTGLITAEYRATEPETDRTDRGLRVERVVRDLTDAKRDGTANAPFKLGDQILVTYRLLSRKLHNYVALEDLLPAGLETVNPNLPLIAKTFELPADNSGRLLSLSHSELRDQSTCLYFDVVDPGVGIYSVLARATSAGTFHWPPTQATPMYDSRFSGLSTARECVVSE